MLEGEEIGGTKCRDREWVAEESDGVYFSLAVLLYIMFMVLIPLHILCLLQSLTTALLGPAQTELVSYLDQRNQMIIRRSVSGRMCPLLHCY